LHYPVPGALAYVSVGEAASFGSSGAASTLGTPITDETTFRVGSITKPIVAALILGAVDRGELELDVPVGRLVPELAHAPVTIRMLLAHTSGIFDEGNEGDPVDDLALLTDPRLLAEAEALDEAYRAGTQAVASDRLLIGLAETHDRYFLPGTGYAYSNINYQVAVRALEASTGYTLSDLLEGRLIDPLGLEHTTIAPPDLSSSDFRGYQVGDDGLHDVTDDLLAFGNGGNGGVLSTAPELVAILRHIIGGGALSEELLRLLTTPTTESGGTYGLGIATYHLTCGTFYGHAGSVNGTQSIALVSPDAATAVVVAVNGRRNEDPALAAVADDLACAFDYQAGR
jgi:D-alanyl-D-alanine carboxypeptidase